MACKYALNFNNKVHEEKERERERERVIAVLPSPCQGMAFLASSIAVELLMLVLPALVIPSTIVQALSAKSCSVTY